MDQLPPEPLIRGRHLDPGDHHTTHTLVHIPQELIHHHLHRLATLHMRIRVAVRWERSDLLLHPTALLLLKFTRHQARPTMRWESQEPGLLGDHHMHKALMGNHNMKYLSAVSTQVRNETRNHTHKARVWLARE